MAESLQFECSDKLEPKLSINVFPTPPQKRTNAGRERKGRGVRVESEAVQGGNTMRRWG